MASLSLDLPEVPFFGRSFNEYLLFSGLRSAELAGRRVLDCAAGPSAFAAEAAARGCDVTAVDPLYNRGEAALRAIATDAFRGLFAQMRDQPQLISTRTFPSVDAAEADRKAALEQFLSDYYVGVAVGRYRCGALHVLPFADGAFDVALCAHLLFTYDHRFDLDFHIAAVRELCRVAPREVRIHPVVNRTGTTSSLLAPVREALSAHGIRSELVDVDHAFFRGTSRTMILRRV